MLAILFSIAVCMLAQRIEPSPNPYKVVDCSFADYSTTEGQLRVLAQLRDSQRIAKMGSWELDIEKGSVIWSEELYTILDEDINMPPPPFSQHGKWFSADSWEEVQKLIDIACKTGKGYEIELEMTGKTPRWGIARGEAKYDENKEIYKLTGTLQDVTEMHKATSKIEQQSQDLARSNKDLEQFAYVASHDLQEPLRAILGCLQIFQVKYGKDLNTEAQELLQMIVEGGDRMKSLISGLLSYSKISHTNRVQPSVDLNKIVEIVKANLVLAIEESKSTLKIDKLPMVSGDFVQLTQLFQNLISNAIKYRNKLVAPIIEIKSFPVQEGWRIAISDNGIGIEKEYRDKIFLIFQRLHSRDEYSGSGIGLALCKKIVEYHGGTLWVEENLPKGSIFNFVLQGRK